MHSPGVEGKQNTYFNGEKNEKNNLQKGGIIRRTNARIMLPIMKEKERGLVHQPNNAIS
jgi:hypothetical protein